LALVLQPVQKPATHVSPPPQFALLVQALLHCPSPGPPPSPAVEHSSTELTPPHCPLLPAGGGGLLQLTTPEGTQLAASPVPVPVQVEPVQPAWPALTHWPLGHWLSFVHRHAVPDALQIPLGHEYGMVLVQPTGSVSAGFWHPRALAVPVPVQVPAVHPAWL
jgi:hypothetical protein